MRRYLLPLLVAASTIGTRGAAQSARPPEPPVTRVEKPYLYGRTAHLTPEQQRRRLDYLPGHALSDAFTRMKAPTMVGTTVLTSGDQQTTYLVVRRKVSSEVEMHARWDDLVIVRSGKGAIEFGERAEDLSFRAPGEWRGGRLLPVHRLVVGPGDVVRIPAAVPHRFEVGSAEPLEYLLIKQRRGDLPLYPKGAPRGDR